MTTMKKVKVDRATALAQEAIDQGDALYYLMFFRAEEMLRLRAENALLKRELRARKRAERRTL
jgi:hypothetical protein